VYECCAANVVKLKVKVVEDFVEKLQVLDVEGEGRMFVRLVVDRGNIKESHKNFSFDYDN